MDKVAVTDINAYVAHPTSAGRRSEKHEVARRKLFAPDFLAGLLLTCRIAWKAHPGLVAENNHDHSRTVGTVPATVSSILVRGAQPASGLPYDIGGNTCIDAWLLMLFLPRRTHRRPHGLALARTTDQRRQQNKCHEAPEEYLHVTRNHRCKDMDIFS